MKIFSWRWSYRRLLLVLLVGGMVIIFSLVYWYFKSDILRGDYTPVPLSFEGESTNLERTVIVPTLDTPMPEGKNVIWCGSFQLAWNHLKDDVIKEQLLVDNAQEVADRLNQAPFSETDLPDDSYYAASGLVADGIIDKITQDMSERFPQVTLPEFNASLEAILSYAYLQAAVDFDKPYFDQQLVFTDSSGQETGLSGFGTHQNIDLNRKLVDQIEVLYQEPFEEPEFYALDLCRTSTPTQIILAQLERKENLADTLDDLENNIDQFNEALYLPRFQWENEQSPRRIRIEDELKVPNIHWKVTHNFTELQGQDKTLKNAAWQNYWIAQAFQRIEFKLDKSGALVVSDAYIPAEPIPRLFYFNKPFLICLKKRGASHPFFVMWVDNAELLCPVK